MLDKFKVLRNAEKLVAGQNYDKAINEYKKLLKVKEDDASVLNSLGDLLLKGNRQEEAVEYFLQVGDIFDESGFEAKAIGVFKKINQLRPDDSEIVEKLMDLYDRQGLGYEAAGFIKTLVEHLDSEKSWDEAVEWQQKYLELIPSDPVGFRKLAELQRESGDLEASSDCFRKAAHLFLSYENEVGNKAALKCVETALEINPEDTETNALLAHIHGGPEPEATVSEPEVSPTSPEPSEVEEQPVWDLTTGDLDEIPEFDLGEISLDENSVGGTESSFGEFLETNEIGGSQATDISFNSVDSFSLQELRDQTLTGEPETESDSEADPERGQFGQESITLRAGSSELNVGEIGQDLGSVSLESIEEAVDSSVGPDPSHSAGDPTESDLSPYEVELEAAEAPAEEGEVEEFEAAEVEEATVGDLQTIEPEEVEVEASQDTDGTEVAALEEEIEELEAAEVSAVEEVEEFEAVEVEEPVEEAWQFEDEGTPVTDQEFEKLEEAEEEKVEVASSGGFWSKLLGRMKSEAEQAQPSQDLSDEEQSEELAFGEGLEEEIEELEAAEAPAVEEEVEEFEAAEVEEATVEDLQAIEPEEVEVEASQDADGAEVAALEEEIEELEAAEVPAEAVEEEIEELEAADFEERVEEAWQFENEEIPVIDQEVEALEEAEEEEVEVASPGGFWGKLLGRIQSEPEQAQPSQDLPDEEQTEELAFGEGLEEEVEELEAAEVPAVEEEVEELEAAEVEEATFEDLQAIEPEEVEVEASQETDGAEVTALEEEVEELEAAEVPAVEGEFEEFEAVEFEEVTGEDLQAIEPEEVKVEASQETDLAEVVEPEEQVEELEAAEEEAEEFEATFAEGAAWSQAEEEESSEERHGAPEADDSSEDELDWKGRIWNRLMGQSSEEAALSSEEDSVEEPEIDLKPEESDSSESGWMGEFESPQAEQGFGESFEAESEVQNVGLDAGSQSTSVSEHEVLFEEDAAGDDQRAADTWNSEDSSWIQSDSDVEERDTYKREAEYSVQDAASLGIETGIDLDAALAEEPENELGLEFLDSQFDPGVLDSETSESADQYVASGADDFTSFGDSGVELDSFELGFGESSSEVGSGEVEVAGFEPDNNGSAFELDFEQTEQRTGEGAAVAESERESSIEGVAEGGSALNDRLSEVDFYSNLELQDDARHLLARLLEDYPEDERVTRRAQEFGLLPSLAESKSESEGDSPIGSEVESALESLFSKHGQDETAEEPIIYEVTSTEATEEQEPRSRYDLALAYREMGMFQDAAEKFEDSYGLASELGDREQAVLSLSMLASTYLQLTEYRKVVEWAERGLELHDSRGFERKSLEYDRSRALEVLGDLRESLDGYRRIFSEDPGFRDVQERIARLDLLSS